jgi:hypothetical protein
LTARRGASSLIVVAYHFRRCVPPVLALVLMGCAASTHEATPPPVAPPPSGRTVVGASDSVESIPGAPNAPYIFRFKQIDPPSGGFNYQDRDLSFYFRPAPDALYFQVENKQNRQVTIQWARSTFYGPVLGSDKVAHSTTTWDNRFQYQADTQIPGLQRYGDFVLPLTYLLDPAGGAQLHRPLIPEDSTSPQYTDRVFGVDLAFLVENQSRTYSFRFRIASVIPR